MSYDERFFIEASIYHSTGRDCSVDDRLNYGKLLINNYHLLISEVGALKYPDIRVYGYLRILDIKITDIRIDPDSGC